MPWIKFERDWNFHPFLPRKFYTVAFKKGMTIFATREGAAQALAGQYARELTEDEIADVRRSRL